MRFQILIFLCFELSITIHGKKSRIIGGTEAVIRDYPFIASIRNASNNHFFCAGSIISEWHILTSGHCLYYFYGDYSTLRIHTGVTSLNDVTGPVFMIDKAYLHFEFRSAITFALQSRFDIAVIKLRSPIEFNEYQQAIDLPNKNIATGNLAIVVGWGHTSYPNGVISERLLKAPMLLFHANDCGPRIPAVVSEDQFCAYNSVGVGTCLGDSGGPVIHDGRLVGAISMSYGCAEGVPDVHANVFMFVNFIKNVMYN